MYYLTLSLIQSTPYDGSSDADNAFTTIMTSSAMIAMIADALTVHFEVSIALQCTTRICHRHTFTRISSYISKPGCLFPHKAEHNDFVLRF